MPGVGSDGEGAGTDGEGIPDGGVSPEAAPEAGDDPAEDPIGEKSNGGSKKCIPPVVADGASIPHSGRDTTAEKMNRPIAATSAYHHPTQPTGIAGVGMRLDC